MTVFQKTLGAILGAAPIFALSLSAANAYSVSPLIVEISQSAPNVTIVATNDDAAAVTLSFDVLEVTVDAEGNQSYAPADQFIVFPPQAIVEPNARQAVQLRLVAPEVDETKRYIMQTSQVPVSLDPDSPSAIRVGFNYHTLINFEK